MFEFIKITPEQRESVKSKLTSAKNITMTTAKYGSIFCGGVLVGTICGVVLFFKISDGDL